MITQEPGVLPDSTIFIHDPTAFGRQALVYAPLSGEYHCVEPYQIKDDSWDAIILLAVDSGRLEASQRGQTAVLEAGSIQLIDRRETHCYRAIGDVRFRWIHLCGGNTQSFFNRLFTLCAAHFPDNYPPAVSLGLSHVFQLLRGETVNDFQVNLALIQLLTALAQAAEVDPVIENSDLNRAFRYIAEHFLEDISLDRIARTANLSTCHFARLFRRQYNTPPHDYILSLRIQEAKKTLLTTDQSVESIALACGFHSATHFIRAFTKRVGKTPAQFRKIRF
jgi:AraC-like DNA-binding protein